MIAKLVRLTESDPPVGAGAGVESTGAGVEATGEGVTGSTGAGVEATGEVVGSTGAGVASIGAGVLSPSPNSNVSSSKSEHSEPSSFSARARDSKRALKPGSSTVILPKPAKLKRNSSCGASSMPIKVTSPKNRIPLNVKFVDTVCGNAVTVPTFVSV